MLIVFLTEDFYCSSLKGDMKKKISQTIEGKKWEFFFGGGFETILLDQ